jgi:hypothetical protein
VCLNTVFHYNFFRFVSVSLCHSYYNAVIIVLLPFSSCCFSFPRHLLFFFPFFLSPAILPQFSVYYPFLVCCDIICGFYCSPLFKALPPFLFSILLSSFLSFVVFFFTLSFFFSLLVSLLLFFFSFLYYSYFLYLRASLYSDQSSLLKSLFFFFSLSVCSFFFSLLLSS